jgi:hypothetical protein
VQFQIFHPYNGDLLVLTADELKWLRPPEWKPVVSRSANGKVLSHLAFSPDHRLLLCVENSQAASICDALTLETIMPMPVWSHPMGLSPDGRWLVVRVAGRRDQLWDFALLRTRFRELGMDWTSPLSP